MPPSPLDRPALEEARPRDTTPGIDHRHVRCLETWTCLFGDGSRRPVTVRGWHRDDLGRLVVSLSWHHGDGTWAGDFLDDDAVLTDPDPGEPTASPRGKPRS